MNNTNRNGLYILSEEPLFESEIVIDKSRADNTVIARAVMQITDVMNANRRIYPRELLERHLELAQPMIAKRRLFGEADHPPADAPMHRILSIRFKDSCHCFNKMWIDQERGRGVVRAIIETTPTTWGYTLAAMLRKGMGVGFSLRSTGRVQMRGDVAYVAEPFKFVTYDAVINPSNEAAFVEEILTEASNCVKERYLTEGKELTSLIESYIEAEVRDCASRMLRFL